MMARFKAWLERFMAGRYGGDAFGSFLCAASLACMVLGLFLWDILYYVGFGLLGYSYYRMMSRKLDKRRAENAWYLEQRGAFLRWLAPYRQRFALRKTYRYFACPHCRQTLRLPRGRGKVSITCPKCGTQFIKKS